MTAPLHFRTASVARRAGAAFINLLSVGLLGQTASFASGQEIGAGRNSLSMQLTLSGLLIVLWLVTVLRRSPGAAVCLLETRSSNMSPLSLRVRTLWTLPYFLLGLVAFAPLPPSQLETIVRGLLLLAGVLAITVDGIVLLVTRRSLRDRVFGVEIFQLSLPDHLKPRLLGRRII